MIKRLICFITKHKWEAYYRGNNKICCKCGKVIPIIVLLFAFALTGCAGMKEYIPEISWNIDKQALAEVAACEIGYQFAKHMPDEAQVALKYAKIVTEATEPGNFNDQLNDWKEYVLEYIGADPHYARQLSKLLPEIELPESAVPDMAWMETVKPYVEEFILCIEEGLPVITSDKGFIQRYCDIYEANYLKFLWARGLP